MRDAWVENRLVLSAPGRGPLDEFKQRMESAAPRAPTWSTPSDVTARVRGLLDNGLTRSEALLHGIAQEAAVRHLEDALPSPDRDDDWLKALLAHLDGLDRDGQPPACAFGGALSLAALAPQPADLVRLTWGLVGRPWYLDNWGVTQDALAAQAHDVVECANGGFELVYTFMTLGGPVAPAIRHASWRSREITFALVCLNYGDDQIHCHVAMAGQEMDFSSQLTRFSGAIITRADVAQARGEDGAAEIASCTYDRAVLDKHLGAAIKAFRLKHGPKSQAAPEAPESAAEQPGKVTRIRAAAGA